MIQKQTKNGEVENLLFCFCGNGDGRGCWCNVAVNKLRVMAHRGACQRL